MSKNKSAIGNLTNDTGKNQHIQAIIATAIVLATLDNLDLLAFFQAIYKYN